VDLTANWRVLAGPGTFDLVGQFNYTKNKITRIDDLPPILRGTNTIYTSLLDPVTINAIEANRPDQRFTLSTTYTQGRVQGVARVMHYGKFKDGSLDGIEEFGAKTLFDSEVGYRWENIKVAVGARNLFNVYPDQVTVEANTNNGTFIYPGASPFGYNGRFIYARTELLLAR
jgi:iron complex outermembrane receptor protein